MWFPFFITPPMILHPRLNPKSGDSSGLGSRSHRLCSCVEKYVKEVQWTSDSVSGEYNANFYKGVMRMAPFLFLQFDVLQYFRLNAVIKGK